MGIVSLVCAAACQDGPVGLPERPATVRSTFDTHQATRIDKLDLLFVIDNSSSMADKHPWLEHGVADLVERLINPPCVNAERTRQYYPEGPRIACESGRREMLPFRNVHIGFITTSLGGHGHETHCEDPEWPTGNDRGHLLPTVRDSHVATYRSKGFLAWDNRLEPLRDPDATRDLAALRKSIETIVASAGTAGCGFEAPLEAWYRFLVDPKPPERVVQRDGTTTREGIDRVLLEQRAAFLRPDSRVIIVMLTDENDCSVRDDSLGHKLGNGLLAPGTSACAEDPNARCCVPCDSAPDSVPDDCPPLGTDPACLAGAIRTANTLCFDQKRRFGVDFLYPTSRYVIGLHDEEICPDSTFPDADCSCRRALDLGLPCDPGDPVPNPLFVDSRPIVARGREPGEVQLVGIVGVPWQDVATSATLSAEGELELEPVGSLDWSLVLGSPGSPGRPPEPPLDILMQESILPRSGASHPRTGIAPQPPESRYDANPINGHEWLPVNGEDLQYACVFPLDPLLEGKARDCNRINDNACACFDPSGSSMALRMQPVCQQSDGSYGSIQTAARAYPSVRQLEVLRDLEGQSIVGSVCPKVLEPDRPDYLYRPVFHQLVRSAPNGGFDVSDSEGLPWSLCTASPLPVNLDTGRVPCAVVEAVREDDCLAECSRMPGRRALDNPRLEAVARERLSLVARCTEEPGKSCPDHCLCEIVQLEGRSERDPLWQCQNLPQGVDPDVFGFCYVSPAQGAGDESVVAQCPADYPRRFRFVGEETPRNGAVTFVACATE